MSSVIVRTRGNLFLNKPLETKVLKIGVAILLKNDYCMWYLYFEINL